MTRKLYILIVSTVIFASAVIYTVFINPDLFKKDEIVPLSKSWEKAVPNQKVPEGLVDLSSKNCGACHQEHYNEWLQSTHAHAWTDLQFQAELKKDSSPFLCINCHIPLQNQQEFIVSGLTNGDIYKPVKTKNPIYDPELQKEGINCASCHVRDGAVIGVNGNLNAPHKVKKDPIHLNETLCISCHNANAIVTPTLACTFQTGDEWKAGPFYDKKNCISCHMEVKERSLVAGYPKRKSHSHYFSGSGIPKFDTVKTTALNGMQITEGKFSKNIKKGELLEFELKLKNQFAGHRLPTGDPERFYLINLEIVNADGKVLKKSTGRIGEMWEWYPIAKKLSDNNLNIGEERSFKIEYKPTVTEKLYIKATVTKHRMDEKTAEYNKLGKNYPLFIQIFETKKEVIVEV